MAHQVKKVVKPTPGFGKMALGLVAAMGAASYLHLTRPDNKPVSTRFEDTKNTIAINGRQCAVIEFKPSVDRTSYLTPGAASRMLGDLVRDLLSENYLPELKSVQRLAGLADGKKYELGITATPKDMTLQYRPTGKATFESIDYVLLNIDVPKEFAAFLNPKNPPTELIYYLNPIGLIYQTAALSESQCQVFAPTQNLLNLWLEKRDWKNDEFAIEQKRVANILENIAKNPEYTKLVEKR